MNSPLLKLAKKLLAERHSHKRWFKTVMCLAMVVVFVTTYMLILPAITLESQDDLVGLGINTATENVNHTTSDEGSSSSESVSSSVESSNTGDTAESGAGSDDKNTPDDTSNSDVSNNDVSNSESKDDIHSNNNLNSDLDNDTINADNNSNNSNSESGGNSSADGTNISAGEPQGTSAPEPQLTEAPGETDEPAASNTPDKPSDIIENTVSATSEPTVSIMPDATEEPNDVYVTSEPNSTIESDASDEPNRTSEPAETNAPTIAPDENNEDDLTDDSEESIDDEIMAMSLDIEDENYILSSNPDGTYTLTFIGDEVPANFMTENEYLAEYSSLISKIIISANVTSIGEAAFKDCVEISSVEFEEGSVLETIGGAAFSGCTGLNSVNLEACTQLKKIDNAVDDMLNDVSLLSGGAFYNTGIKNITIPASLEFLDSAAFYNCGQLKTVTIEEGSKLQTLGFSVFGQCTALESINLEACQEDSISLLNGALYRERGMFNGCKSLKSLTVPHGFGADTSNNNLNGLCLNCPSLESLVFEENSNIKGSEIVNIINENCNSLNILDLTPLKALSTIQNWSFQNIKCTTVKFPASLTTLGYQCFLNSTNLANLVFEDPSALKTIDGGAFKGCTALRAADMSEMTGLESLGQSSFYGCVSLERVVLPSNLKYIGKQAFAECTNLQEVVYNIGNLIIESGNDNRSCENIFENVNSDFTLTIAIVDNVNISTLNAKLLQEAAGHCGDVLFTCEGALLMKINGTDGNSGLAEPLGSLDDGIYLLYNGVLYELCDESSSYGGIYVLHLVYCPPGLTDLTVLSGIDFGNDTYAFVEAVDSYAFSLARDLQSVTFPYPQIISSVGEYAFYGCEALTSVGGNTTVEDAAAYFTSADVPENAFYNTGLEGAVNENEIKGEKTTEALQVDEYLTVSVSDFDLMTGETAKVTINVSDGLTEEKKYRLYFKYDGDLDYSYSQYLDGEEFTLENLPVKLKSTDKSNVYYYEFTAASGGNTVTFALDYSYKNHTAGGDVQFWVVPGSGNNFETENNAIFTTDDDKYFEVVWETQESNFSLSKTQNEALTPALTAIADGEKIGLGNLSYNININRTDDTVLEGKGSDVVKYIDFRDTLTLPDLVSYREGVIDAVKSGNYGRRALSDGSISIYVIVDDVEYTFCTLSNTANIVTLPKLEVDESGNLVLCWRENNSSINSATKSEINNVADTITYSSSILIVDEAVEQNSEFQISNHVDADVNYSFAGVKTLSGDCGPTIVNTGSGDITLSKKLWNSDKLYMGEDVEYTVTVKNTSAYSYTLDKTLTDGLSETQYIKAENIEAMFNNPDLDPDKLHVIITGTEASLDGAYLLGTPIESEVTSVDGSTTAKLSTQNTGENIPYVYPAKEDSSMEQDKYILEFYLNEQWQLVLKCDKVGEGTVKTITIGTDEPDVNTALNNLGFIITNKTKYILEWRYTDTEIQRGKEKSYTYTATIKDSFMLLEEDRIGYISNDSSTSIANTVWYSDDKRAETYVGNVNKDFIIDKSVSSNGKGELDSVADGDVINYGIGITHDGSNTYDVLPVVDSFDGIQLLLVPVESNQNQTWVTEDLETYTNPSDNREYYILNMPGEYEGVWIEGNYADTVTVTESEDGVGLNTLIKWYYTDFRYSKNINYKVLVSAELSGVDVSEYNDKKFELVNVAAINDHQTHRLYDGADVIVPIINLDKDIVIQKGDTPADDIIEASGHLGINRGDSIVYKLTLTNTQNANGEITGADIYDALPKNGWWSNVNELFKWEKGVNVSMSYAADDGVVIDNQESWSISYDLPNTGFIDRQQYILWGNDFKISFDSKGSAYIYVTLQFPEDASVWKSYSGNNGGEMLFNTMHLYEFSASVSHELVDKGIVLLQKGVYETGLYSYNFSSTGATDVYADTYKSGYNRFYYENQDINKHAVSYYVILHNSGNNRLYLTDLYDELPEGFVFYKLNNNTNPDSWGSIQNSHIYDNQQIKVPDGSGFSSIDGSKSMGAIIKYELLGNVDGHNMVKFTITDGRGDGYEELHYDADLGMYYLNPNEYIQFGYTVFTGKREDSLDEAVNTIGMEYYDYQNSGAELDTTTKVNVSTANGLSENNGSRELLSNDEALRHAFNTGSEASQWLVSDVSVTRGDIVPGITKSVKEAIVKGDEVVDWEVKASSNGEASITDYTIKDTMQAPYAFTGTVNYIVYYTADDTVKKLAPQTDSLFTFGSRNRGDTSVPITSNIGTTYSLAVNGEPTEVLVNWNEANVYVYASLSRDENDNETLLIRFPDYRMSIPANGYGVLSLSTNNLTNNFFNSIYVNEAYIIPEQDYDADRITQGNNVTSEVGENIGVRNSAFVTTTTAYYTSSVKTITEKDNSDNSASSDEDVNYILLNDKDNTFTYTLSVNNNNDKSMKELVIIDNLPELNDHNTLVSTDLRYSEFKVSLAEMPEFKVTVNGTELDSSKYTIDYSDKTEFTATSDDWKTDYDDGWYSSPTENTRSIRLIIKDENSEDLIPENSTVSLSFDAVISGGEAPKPGQTAWNSFAYSYKVDSSTLFAAPLVVGLRISSVPNLSKTLVNSLGDEVKAQKDEGFEFIIYSGSKLTFDDYKLETVAGTLESHWADNREFTYVKLNVNEGESVSETITLDNLKKYSYYNYDFHATDDDWNWGYDNKSFNIVEIDNGSLYDYKFTNGRNSRDFSFVYNPAQNLTIRYVNERPDWAISIDKVDSSGNPLSGAVFGLYSSNQANALDNEALEALETQYGDCIQGVIQVDNTDYYLYNTAVSSEAGKAEWYELGEDKYIVRELKPPDGYYITENDFTFDYDAENDVQSRTIINYAGAELPSTGGTGLAGVISAVGGLMVAAAIICGLYISRRKRI